MPTPTIPAGNLFMNATTYTGDNTTPKSITNGVAGQAFQPDFVWLKSRSNAYQNNLYDSVRGAGSAYALSSDQTAAEGGNSNVYGYLSAFNSNGFAVTQGSAGSGGAPNGNAYTNQTSTTYVAWQWKAGGTAVTNTSGTISSQVSANTTAGFSIISYTGNGTAGATIGHGLGVAPDLFFCKDRVAATSWPVYHSFLGGTKWLALNGPDAATTSAQEWNNTNPTSSVITLGSGISNGNQASQAYIGYAWTAISGYSKFGGYTGNSSTDGVFIYTGFRPKFIFIKNYQSSVDWYFEDSARDTYNVASSVLSPNTSSAESSGTYLIDFLSNGFKIRTANGNINSSGNSYIYGCWAENPFKYANAR